MISAVIYDMDGLLIDSEPYWQKAELEVFGAVGVPLTPELCQETMGLRIDALVEHWFQRFPWSGKSCAAVAWEVASRVAELIHAHAQPLPGVAQSIAFFKERALPLAVCSSSPETVIQAALAKLGILQHMQLVHSADADAFGKPHPAPYLTVAARLERDPRHCLVFEDSLNGAISAKAARMKVIAVPEPRLRASTRFDFCDAKLDSLADVSAELFERL